MLKKSDPHSSAQAVTAFLILAVAFAILFTFYKNRDAIVASGNLNSFVFLTFVGSTLLLGLLYLVYKPITNKTPKKRKR